MLQIGIKDWTYCQIDKFVDLWYYESAIVQMYMHMHFRK